MSRIFVHGSGAVSPAGWGREPLIAALREGREIESVALERPGRSEPLWCRRVPAPPQRPAFFTHPRLRRVSPITRFATAAALEALGDDRARVEAGELRVGVVYCVMAGCVNYSRRFYDEAWRDPATASPLVFPETVFNAPASHLSALLGSAELNHTLVGDDTAFVHGLVTAAGWLTEGHVDGVLVIGAEECDWLTADALRLFEPDLATGEGAGAIYLKSNRSERSAGELTLITDPHLFLPGTTREPAVSKVHGEIGKGAECLVDSGAGGRERHRMEQRVWRDRTGPRWSPRRQFGFAFTAATAWQFVAAVAALEEHATVAVAVEGTNQEAIGARLER